METIVLIVILAKTTINQALLVVIRTTMLAQQQHNGNDKGNRVAVVVVHGIGVIPNAELGLQYQQEVGHKLVIMIGKTFLGHRMIHRDIRFVSH